MFCKVGSNSSDMMLVSEAERFSLTKFYAFIVESHTVNVFLLALRMTEITRLLEIASTHARLVGMNVLAMFER